MTIVITVSDAGSSRLVAGLADAVCRSELDYALFFTGSGVDTLTNPAIVERASRAVEAIACEHAWQQYQATQPCPINIGSQTDHSRLLKSASRMITF